MSTGCIDEQRLIRWCDGIAGNGLAERRSDLFWQYLNSQVDPELTAEIREHLTSCEDCRAAFAAEELLWGAKSGTKVAFAVCLAGEELLNYTQCSAVLSQRRRLEIKRHLDRRVMCRDEANWAARNVVS